MIVVEWSFYCDMCDVVSCWPAKPKLGDSVPAQHPPAGWIRIGNRLICDQHGFHKMTIGEAVKKLCKGIDPLMVYPKRSISPADQAAVAEVLGLPVPPPELQVIPRQAKSVKEE